MTAGPMTTKSMTAREGERLEELLVARAVEGMTPDERAELRALLRARDTGEWGEGNYDEAAAWFWLGAGDRERALPDRVRQRLENVAVTAAEETPPPRPPPPDSGAHAPRPARLQRAFRALCRALRGYAPSTWSAPRGGQ